MLKQTTVTKLSELEVEIVTRYGKFIVKVNHGSGNISISEVSKKAIAIYPELGNAIVINTTS